jgi:enoyl-CoA hydratase/3-hydroxyacyl-CoA dehydrogenase
LNNADLIIEAVPEDMNLKRKVYAEIDKYTESKMIYASNTSTLPITEMARLTLRPEKFVGVHFFNPPQLMQLVEVIPGAMTDQGTIQTVTDFVKHVGNNQYYAERTLQVSL